MPISGDQVATGVAVRAEEVAVDGPPIAADSSSGAFARRGDHGPASGQMTAAARKPTPSTTSTTP